MIPAGPQLQALDGSFPRQRYMAVFPAGPKHQAPDQSGPRRTSTTSSRSQCALPDLNRERQISVGTAGPQPRV